MYGTTAPMATNNIQSNQNNQGQINFGLSSNNNQQQSAQQQQSNNNNAQSSSNNNVLNIVIIIGKMAFF